MHKNSQRRIYGDYVYFITCDVQDKFEFFKESLFCDLWIEELKLCKEINRFKLIAFCLNYEHFHWLIKPNIEIADYSKIMQFMKRHFSRNANIILGYNAFHFEGDIGQCRLQKCGNRELWQNEMDEFIFQMREKFISIHGSLHIFPKFKWQKSFHDHIVRDQKDYEHHWNYTMYNFAKHGLPEDWRYTGLNFLELIDEI